MNADERRIEERDQDQISAALRAEDDRLLEKIRFIVENVLTVFWLCYIVAIHYWR